MGIIMHENVAYGGGSVVEANKTGATPTDNLSTLTIDGVTYDTTELVFCFDDNGSLYTDSTKATAVTGDESKLYIATNTGKQYRYNGSTFSALGVNAIGDLSDVTITSASDGQALEYDATAGKWKNVAKKAADTPTFSEASTRANISGSGETMATILGKIKKWFSDLKDLAFKAIDGSNSKKYLRGDGTWQSALELQGRVYGSGDDEGLVIKPASNDWVGITLGGNTGRRTYFAMKDNDTNAPFWRYSDGTDVYNIYHPAKSGTIAVTSDITDEKVTGELQNPSSGTWYYVPFIGTTNQKPYYNNGLRCVAKEGTASADGEGSIILGNSTASGTAGNKKGYVGLYSGNSRLAYLHFIDSATADRAFALPDKSGTIALTSDLTPENIGAVPIRKDYDTYTQLAKLYTGGTDPAYVRISFPSDISTVWTMLNIEILFRQNYQNNLGGKILINCSHNQTSPYTWTGNATVYGYLRKGDIKVYGSDGHYLYIEGIDAYSTISVEKVIVGDTARGKDLTSTILEIVSALPSGYQTFTMYTDVDSSNIASQSVSYADTAGSATDNTKVSKSGDYMTGRLSIKEDSVALNLRPNNANYYATVSYQTAGNEALVFATKQGVTSFMFVNNEDSETNHASNRWQSLTPALQIKNNKVAIGKLIAQGTDLTYPLEVNGDVQATNFRGALIGNADTATQATKDGDGNTISSTYAKLANTFPMTGVTGGIQSTTTGLQDAFSITLPTAGRYIILAWLYYPADQGSGQSTYQIQYTDTSNTVKAQNRVPSDSSNPKEVTLMNWEVTSSANEVRKIRGFTARGSLYNPIRGGALAFKIADS